MPIQESITSLVRYLPVREDDAYRVGDDGSVWSCLWPNGPKPAVMCPGRWRRLKGCAQRYGHIIVRLSGNRWRFIHRLVLEAFVGPCPEGMECCHLDGDPGNNRLDNLAWGTRAENHMDSFRHGTAAHLRPDSPLGRRKSRPPSVLFLYVN